MNALLVELSQPFRPEDISWKPGSTTKDGSKCMALCYADLRAYQDRLDEICGLDWSCRYMPWSNGSIICELTLYVGDSLGRRDGITRSSTGESDAQDEKNNMAGSVSEAMAFKRAAAMFGLGRYLYELPAAWVAYDAVSKKISKDGQAELDNRYATWYTKKMAAAASKRTKPASEPLRVVDQDTGEIVSPEPATDSLGDVLFVPDANKESPPHQRLWGIGQAVFGKDDWDAARSWVISGWTMNETPQTVRNSAAQLSDDEKSQLGDYLNANATRLQKLWPDQKKVMERRMADAKVAA